MVEGDEVVEIGYVSILVVQEDAILVVIVFVIRHCKRGAKLTNFGDAVWAPISNGLVGL